MSTNNRKPEQEQRGSTISQQVAKKCFFLWQGRKLPAARPEGYLQNEWLGYGSRSWKCGI